MMKVRLVELYNRYKSRLSNLGIYFWAALIPMVLSLGSNPFIAKNMSPEDYAIVGYYTAFNSLFVPLINFYFLHYYTKRYFELNGESRTMLRATIFKSLIVFSFAIACLTLLGLYVYTTILNKSSEIPFLPYAVVSVLSLPVSCIYSLQLVDYRMSRDSKKFFRLSVSNGIALTTMTLLFVVLFKWGAIGKLAATFATNIVFFIIVFFANRNLLSFHFDKKTFFDAIKFCWPLVLASMFTFFSSGYDKVILERQGDIVMLGIYSVGVSIANYLSVFSTSINDTFQPDIYENVVKRDFTKVIKIIALKLAVLSVCVIAFIIFAPFLIKVLTFGRYVSSTPYARIVSLSAITSMMYYSVSQVTVALGFTSITLLNKVIGGLLSVFSFYFLINNFGAIGAAWGVVLSYLYFFAGNIILVSIKYRRTHHNENRNTDISSAD